MQKLFPLCKDRVCFTASLLEGFCQLLLSQPDSQPFFTLGRNLKKFHKFRPVAKKSKKTWGRGRLFLIILLVDFKRPVMKSKITNATCVLLFIVNFRKLRMISTNPDNVPLC